MCWLFRSGVDSGHSECERAERRLCEARACYQLAHIVALCHGADAVGQIAVGVGVVRHQAACRRNHMPGIEIVERPHVFRFRSRQLEHHKQAAGAQHTLHLAVAGKQILEIAHAEGHCHGIETCVGKRQRQAVGHSESDACVKAGASHFVASDGNHAFRQVYARDTGLGYSPPQRNGQVARAGGNIEYVAGFGSRHHLHHAASPQPVDAKGHGAVHKIIGGGDAVEHLPHLFAFAARVAGIRRDAFRALCHIIF